MNDFYVTARDVGEPLLVTLEKDGGSFDPDWFVDRVKIKKVGASPGIIYDFPCNRWVQNESVTIFEGTGKTWVLNKKLVANAKDGFFLNHFSLVIRIHVFDIFIYLYSLSYSAFIE